MDPNVLKRGMNLHSEGYALKDDLATEKYFKIIKAAGFDHVRLPSRGAHLLEGGHEYFDHVKSVCDCALNCGLIPILDMHGYPKFNEDTYAAKDGFIGLWSDIAEYSKNWDERIIFELINEPARACTFKVLNEIQNECIEAIRRHQPTRLIAAATAHMNTIENLHFLLLPEDDKNIFVTIHDYTPMEFTHQNMNEKHKTDSVVKWGSKVEREYLEARFEMTAAWSRWRNRSINLGEFGVFFRADMNERAEWTSFMARLCEKHGFSWSYWEFSKGFGAFDKNNEQWREPLLKALIPETK